MISPFVHLHCHTDYSLFDGVGRIHALVEMAKQTGMNALAITDFTNLFGAVEFHTACTRAGINPIIGYEALVAPRRRSDRDTGSGRAVGFHLTLIAQNATGFHNLIRMASLAATESDWHEPRIDKELLEAHKGGIICLSGCTSGEFSQLIREERIADATSMAGWYARVFGNNYYIEIQKDGSDHQANPTEAAIDVANRLGLPCVATCDVHYLRPDDASVHEVIRCIATGRKFGDERRVGAEGKPDWFRTPEEVYRLFPGRENVVRRSQEIADSCDVRLDTQTRHVSAYTTRESVRPEDVLNERCEARLRDRYSPNPPSPAAIDRLRRELAAINQSEIAGLLLILDEVGTTARRAGHLVTTLSAEGGSLVMYALRLSVLDPIEYELHFERWFHAVSTRNGPVSIATCVGYRRQAIDALRRQLGAEHVAEVGAFGTFNLRSALSTVAEVLSVPPECVKRLADMMSTQWYYSLTAALRENADLRSEYDSDRDLKKTIDLATALEGLCCRVGPHAASVVITDEPLIEHVPLFVPASRMREGMDPIGENVATQWGDSDLERIGLTRFELVGSRALTRLEKAIALIERNGGSRIDLNHLPLNDARAFALLQRGDTSGVYQLGTDGMRELLRQLLPDCIRDLSALIALAHPGPLESGMMDAFIARKRDGQQPPSPHPVVDGILAETYGVLVYQEQTMCILHRLGGIDLESAYVCIKDISKKKMECVDRFEKEFVLGCLDRVCPKAVAHEVFEIITRFGGYGVCKAFTLANALVSYQMAYIKAHHPAEFSEALLSDHDASDALHELSASNPELLLRYRELITRYSSHDVEVIRNLLPGDEVFIGGKVTNVRTQRMEGTRKGEGPRYAVFRLEDFSGSIECVIWPNTFARNESQLVNDYVYFVGGVVEHLCTERSLLVTKLMTPEAVHHKRTRRRGSN